ncbi:hypothetical protein BX661DRAFT_183697 [Kickxella alabastrina]|uniref:uncharacterized protein n=1 Tax=Kickxella alabastrina TaxID=61397 RepID=UPI00221F0F08|nr:uncharacterized protein BX661DRAFT_183697 [Kickxella alabastrina]KAI7826253.1 hypothetical protein BX661DRAFT_183697 [Kickxella alabastrina]
MTSTDAATATVETSAPVLAHVIGVKMHCGGCSGAVKKALIKSGESEDNINIEMGAQSEVVEIIRKTGKKILTVNGETYEPVVGKAADAEAAQAVAAVDGEVAAATAPAA